MTYNVSCGTLNPTIPYFWMLMKQEMMGWQWHQLDHMRISCTLLKIYYLPHSYSI